MFETSIQDWNTQNLWNTAFKKLEVIWSIKTDHITPLKQTISLQIF